MVNGMEYETNASDPAIQWSMDLFIIYGIAIVKHLTIYVLCIGFAFEIGKFGIE